MSTLRDPSHYITQYLSQSQLDNHPPIQHLSQLIINKDLTLLKLIQLLGDYLTAEDEVLRAHSVALLARVLKELSSTTDSYSFNNNDTKVLLKFMLVKMDEPKAIGEALIGITALVGNTLDESLLSEVFKDVNEKYPETGNPASVRYQAFLLLKALYDAVIGHDGKYDSIFIELFIKVATNEKDPRNLLLSFEMNGKISMTLDTSKYYQELFDLLYCYFPINFKPPKNDPYKITEDQLKGGLNTALAANSLFQDDLLESNLENFSNSNFNYKSDSVKLLSLFFDHSNRKVSDENFLKLFQVLKFEILNINLDDEEDQEMLTQLSSLLKSVIMKLSQEQTVKLHELINDQFFKELNFNNRILHKDFLFLTAIASTSLQNFNYIFSLTITELFQNLDHNTSSKRELIKIITLFLDSHITILPKLKPEDEDQLSQNKEKLLIFLSDTLMSSSLIEVTLRNLSLIALRGLTPYLSQDETSLVITYYFETLKGDKNEHIFKSCISGLNAVQGKNDVLVSELQGLISGLFEDGNDDSYVFKIMRGLENKDILSVIIEVLLGKVIHLAGIKSDDHNDVNVKNCFKIVDNLIQIISGSFKTYQLDLTVFTNIIEFVLNSNDGDIILNIDLFERFTDLVKLFVMNLSEDDQNFLYYDAVKVYQKDTSIEIFQGLNIYETTGDVKVYLLLKCLAGLSVKLFSNVEDMNIEILIQYILATSFSSEFIKMGYLQLLCLLINKYNYKDSSQLPDISLSTPQEIETYTWITKALLLKMSPLSDKYLDSLITLLSTTDDLSQLFEILCVDLPLFTPSSTPSKVKINNMRLLYKQKFYGIVIPQLISKYQSESGEFKYLQSLSILMKDENKELLLSYIDPLFQIFLSSKDQLLENKEYAKLETFLKFVKISMLKITGFDKYLNTMMDLFQTILKDFVSDGISVGLRLTILENISEFLKLNVTEVVKLKTPVLRLLQSLSNDKSRKVRKLNVDVRQQWFELGVSSSAD